MQSGCNDDSDINLLTTIKIFYLSSFSKRYVIRRAYPTAYDDVVFVSEKTMRDILSEDLTKVEKRYNQSLNYLALDNDMLALNLKNKTNDYDRLNKQYKAQQVNET